MLANGVKETTTTTGTGTLTLASSTGYARFAQACVVGELVDYVIKTSDGKWEWGIGTVGASNTLERTNVLATFDGTTYNRTTASALTLVSGTHEVFISALAERSIGALQYPFTNSMFSNRVVASCGISASQANVPAGAAVNRATAWPFVLMTSGLLTAFAGNCSVLGAGSSIHIALYECNSSGIPGRRIVKTSAAIDTSTTGFKSQSVDGQVRLQPGVYWIAVCVVAGTGVPSFTGGITTTHPIGLVTNSVITALRSDTFATDLADPFPAATLVQQGASGSTAPYIGLVLA